MNAATLIEKLRTMPPGAEVDCLLDGYLRSTVEHVWLTNGGKVALADFGEPVYSRQNWPTDYSGPIHYRTPRKS